MVRKEEIDCNKQFLLSSQYFLYCMTLTFHFKCTLTFYLTCQFWVSAADKDMMSKILTEGIQFSDRIENIVGKEEIARYEQFLLFTQCFLKLSIVNELK